MKSNPTTSENTTTEDYRTIDVAGRVTIFTRKNNTQKFHDIRDDIESLIPSHKPVMIDYNSNNLPRDSELSEPRGLQTINNIIREDKRYLTNPRLEETYKCICGEYSLKPVKEGLRHQAIVQCKCESCYAQIYIELPFKKNQ